LWREEEREEGRMEYGRIKLSHYSYNDNIFINTQCLKIQCIARFNRMRNGVREGGRVHARKTKIEPL
jgi:hypothetical protein